MPLHREAWARIGASDSVLEWIDSGVPVPLVSVPERSVFENPRYSEPEKRFLEAELLSLQKRGVIEKVISQPHCVSPIKVVPKKNSKFRLICDLRYVNAHCAVQHFSSEGVSVLPEVMRNGELAVTVDLKDGFYHFPVHAEYRTFLGFQYGGSWFVWCVLPFGMVASPYYFHKCIRAVIEHLRGSKNLCVMAYVDDFLLTSTKSAMSRDLKVFLDTLEMLGLCVNWQKSCLTPSETVSYLGFDIHCARHNDLPLITVPKSKVSKLKQDIARVLKRPTVSARLLARVAGRCISMMAAVFPAKLKLRNVYRMLNSRRTWDEAMSWSAEAREDLAWWITSLDGWNGRLLVPPATCDLQLSTDASGTGWGATLSAPVGQTASGFWGPEVSAETSNFRELLAVYLALLSFKRLLYGKTVEILSDNVTVVALINRLGASQPRLDAIAQNIWAFAFQHQIMLVAHHISGYLNVQPDELSRIPLRHEWTLHLSVFRQLERMFGPHTVDRFASLATALMPVYNSRFLDPCTSGIDALGQSDWRQHNNYVNPPFRLISRVLDVIEAQRAQATLIAPLWPGQPWMGRLRRLSVCPPVRLPPVTQSCLPLLPHQQIEPHRNRRWTLCAWRISGEPG